MTVLLTWASCARRSGRRSAALNFRRVPPNCAESTNLAAVTDPQSWGHRLGRPNGKSVSRPAQEGRAS